MPRRLAPCSFELRVVSVSHFVLRFFVSRRGTVLICPRASCGETRKTRTLVLDVLRDNMTVTSRDDREPFSQEHFLESGVLLGPFIKKNGLLRKGKDGLWKWVDDYNATLASWGFSAGTSLNNPDLLRSLRPVRLKRSTRLACNLMSYLDRRDTEFVRLQGKISWWVNQSLHYGYATFCKLCNKTASIFSFVSR